MHILLSRTDSIGDVMLTLPMAGIIKAHFPDAFITFLGRSYTESVIKCCEHVNQFLNWDSIENLPKSQAVSVISKLNVDACIHVFPNKKFGSLAKLAGIALRIGTAGRIYHWTSCNKLVRFSRRKSDLHEAQLNLKLLGPLNIHQLYSKEELASFYGFTKIPEVTDRIKELIKTGKKNIIIHPKSKGSAVEWGLQNYHDLIKCLPKEKYHVFVSGTKEDKLAIGNSLPLDNENVTSLLDKLSLSEFIAFISITDALIAASTGPLHISSAIGKLSLGLYSSRKPIHPGRWAPIGRQAHYLVFDEQCKSCGKGEACECIKKISPTRIKDFLDAHFYSVL